MSAARSALLIGVTITLVLLVGVPIFEALAGQPAIGAGGTVSREAALLSGPGTFVSLGDAEASNETVYETTGFAMNFSGAADSSLSASEIDSFGNDTSWTVSVWAHVDTGAGSDTMTITSISDGELILYYNGSASEWVAWYYKQSTRDSYEVAVATTSPIGDFVNIQVTANDSELAIYRNGTSGASTADITTSSTVPAPTEADTFDGRVEELRTFDRPLDAANRSALINEPTNQTKAIGADRSARLMFDQPDSEATLILFTGESATPSNVTFSAGFGENILEPATAGNNLAGTSDYEFRTDGPAIAPVDNGEIDGAPVAYVSYDRKGLVDITSLTSWISIAALTPLILIATLIISRVR